MPREDRRVIFDMTETYKALYKLSYKQEGAPKLIAGAIKKIEEDDENSKNLKVFVMNPQEGTHKTIIYTRDFMAAALMLYCRGEGIPLPRKAQKTVILRDGEVILRIVV